MARCVHCPAWTVVEYGGGKFGPCIHAFAPEPEYSSTQLMMKYEQAVAREKK